MKIQERVCFLIIFVYIIVIYTNKNVFTSNKWS